jgi:hypothetical protein
VLGSIPSGTTSLDTEWCQAFFYFNYLNTDFSEIVRKQFTVAKYANHNFILVYINNSIGVIIPILVKKATNSIFFSLWRFNLINCRAN